ncbi:unnamed protein product [Thelazia callipaeda]|uniref:CNH domain-containing protein n=1 Tax=Thelazia callipaeda TaxID=103827 RepID=A0A0N5D4Z8_THECL|nr:unnamed protein product [Thelazia callipaeda]
MPSLLVEVNGREMPQPSTSSFAERSYFSQRYLSATNNGHNNNIYIDNNNINNDNNNINNAHRASTVANESSNASVVSTQSIEMEEDFRTQNLASISQKYGYYLMPNKSQVLFYLSDAPLLRIRRAGTELQITDSIDFPLFDIWKNANCIKSTMILESYGRTVLLISENSSTGYIFGKKSKSPLVIINDWNGDLFGYFVPGDPFLIEDNDKRTIAKILAAESAYGRTSVWVCVLEGSGREIARMEEYHTIYFAKDVGGFQFKLLALAAFARLTASECIQTQSCCCSFFSLLLRY